MGAWTGLILLDLDGALVDSFPAITAPANRALLGRLGWPGVFAAVERPESTGPRKPNPRMVRGVLQAVGVGFLILFITNPALALYLLFSLMSGGGGGGFGGGGFGGGGHSGGGGASGGW